ncbi:GNAT family N-acetyltransferase [Schlegelella sp. S2-27]|uniref:GNAT family N-acetyltransferase n=1 Tax=Caldimonas mangrovi TaxID=2944811 RepID=A0ABT0YLD0_9BURK|nr:GNAT family N-acetyltransferase [Caldimonas mangrovi]MCM5679541.1 GNAT family N-acetyltransferase [Caldimonas mangrovi]
MTSAAWVPPAVQPPIEFTTGRLRLRRWQDEDRAAFAALNADPHVMAFFPSTLSREQSDAVVDRLQAHFARHGWGFWAAELKATAQFIGFVGLNVPAAQLPCSPCVEIGWRLARAHWGQGYATEAARAALRVGFDRLALDEIVSFTALANLRSQAVMERLGMRRDAQTFEHPAVPAGHALREHCLYRLRRGWRPAQQ